MTHFTITNRISSYQDDSDLKTVWRLAVLSLTLHLAAGYLLSHTSINTSRKAPEVIMVEMSKLPQDLQPVTQPVIARPAPVHAATGPSSPAAPAVRPSMPLPAPVVRESVPHSDAREIQTAQVQHGTPALQKKTVPDSSLHTESPVMTQPIRNISPPPSAVDGSRARKAYNSNVRELIERNKQYPVMARRGRMEGKVTVHFVLTRSGKLKSVSVSSPSQYQVLNQAALEAVKSVNRFPPLPQEIEGEEAGFDAPISFAISER